MDFDAQIFLSFVNLTTMVVLILHMGWGWRVIV
jgi:hypothetical protein